MNEKDNLVNGYPPGGPNYPAASYMGYGNGISPQTSYGIGMNPGISAPPINPNLNYGQPGAQAFYPPLGHRYPMQIKNMNYGQNNPLQNLINEGRTLGHPIQNASNGLPLHAGNYQHQRMMNMQQRQNGPTVPYAHSRPYSRPTFREDAEQWTVLDMSRASLRSLSPQLFQYTFLTELYLEHNDITYLPPEFSQLKNLVKLDLSGNSIQQIPPELGQLVNLKELSLHDNTITTLPFELGFLYRLEKLTLDNNPISEPIKEMLATSGTSGVISFLRDSHIIGEAPPKRIWESYEKDDKDEFERATIMCYNVLSDKYATPQQYGYTPSWALDWAYRRDKILNEILDSNADIVCLQELEAGQFETFFKPELAQKDYEGIFWCKTRVKRMSEKEKPGVDGCATFYRSSKFTLAENKLVEFGSVMDRTEFRKTADTLNRLMNRDNIAGILTLERADKKYKILVANAHIHWDPEFADVKLIQTAMLTKELEKVVDLYNKKNPNSKLPVLICGDFNSLPGSGVYSFLDRGEIAKDHPEIKDRDYGDFSKDGLRHSLMLKSAYKGINFTNFTPNFTGVIDYIWYTHNSLVVTHTLGPIDPRYTSRFVGFPNADFPSDHIPLMIEVKIKTKNTKTSTTNFNYLASKNALNSSQLTGQGPSTQTFNQKKTSKVTRPSK